MPGGIRPRLQRLTKPEMKTFVSDAVAANKQAADKKPGDTLLADLNKSWTVVLKAQREYESMVQFVEQSVKATVGKDLDDPAFSSAQAAINKTNKRLKEINADLLKFEAAEKKLAALLKIKLVPAGS